MERTRLENDSFLNELLRNDQVSRAYAYGKAAHDGQMRKDGVTPYFTHCVEVTKILYGWGIRDENILSAGLLHDTVEDTSVTLKDIRSEFNEDVASLVDGVSKFEPEDGNVQENNDELTVMKVFDRNLVDFRVSLIKLGDRLHNMRTLGPLSEDKRRAKADETITVYAKLAESLGMWVVMKELEDLSLEQIQPDKYKLLKDAIDSDPRNDELFIAHMTSKLKSILSENNICGNVELRKTGVARFMHKIERGSDIKSVNDLVSFRIVLKDSTNADPTRDMCYKATGLVRDKFRSIENVKKFDDSYFHPKANNYSSIQLTLDTPQGQVEIGIQPESKESFNNWGVVSLINRGETNLTDYALKLVFTPTGQVKFFRREATGVDFALSISPSMLTQAKGVIIDGKPYPLSTIIPNNAKVLIDLETKRQIAPDPRLLDYCLPENRSIILEQLSHKESGEYIEKGKNLIQSALNPRGLFSLGDLRSFEQHRPGIEALLYTLGCKGSLQKLFYDIGSGGLSLDKVNKELDKIGITKEKLNLTSIVIDGNDGPGILEIVGEQVRMLNGNIGAINLQRDKNSFKLRLVIENMSEGSNTKLTKVLLKKIKGSQISIV